MHGIQSATSKKLASSCVLVVNTTSIADGFMMIEYTYTSITKDIAYAHMMNVKFYSNYER